jgi:hypothetical protein
VVGEVEAFILITLGVKQIGNMVVGTCPDDGACTRIATMGEQSLGVNTSFLGSMHTYITV